MFVHVFLINCHDCCMDMDVTIAVIAFQKEIYAN